MDKTGRDSAELDGVLGCEQWEAILADKMDQASAAASEGEALSPEAEAAFAEHSLHCPGCGELMEQARKGQQWLRVLNEARPAPPVDLLSKILARTRGAGAETDFPLGTAAMAGVQGAMPPARWSVPFLPQASASLLAMRRAHNARLLMTAAMAFFSVALTLSVAGVKITSVHAAELRPQVMQANMTRSFYGTKKQIVSFYENLRLVYEVESKVQDLRRDVETAPTTTTQPAPRFAPQAKPQRKSGAPTLTPRPRGSAAATPGSPADHKPVQIVRGRPELVSFMPRRHRAFAGRNRVSGPAAIKSVSNTLFPGAISKERNCI